MKRLSLLSESKTESLYYLQTVPFETYVLNCVLASTIGKFEVRRETKNPHPKVRKKSVNTKKNRDSYESRFLVRVFITKLLKILCFTAFKTYSDRALPIKNR
jgi:hypothetical protein